MPTAAAKHLPLRLTQWAPPGCKYVGKLSLITTILRPIIYIYIWTNNPMYIFSCFKKVHSDQF